MTEKNNDFDYELTLRIKRGESKTFEGKTLLRTSQPNLKLKETDTEKIMRETLACIVSFYKDIHPELKDDEAMQALLVSGMAFHLVLNNETTSEDELEAAVPDLLLTAGTNAALATKMHPRKFAEFLVKCGKIYQDQYNKQYK